MMNQMMMKLQDQLTGDLIGLVRSAEGSMHRVTDSTHEIILEGLVHTSPDADADEEKLQLLIERVDAEKRQLVPNCFDCAAPCGRTNRFDMENLWCTESDSAALRVVILEGLRSLAGYDYKARLLDLSDEALNLFFYKALYAVGRDDWSMDELLSICIEMGDIARKCRIKLKQE